MQTHYHQGSRLKNLIEKSGKKTAKVAELSQVPRSSIYKMFEKPELLPGDIKPILEVIGITTEKFYAVRTLSKIGNSELHDDGGEFYDIVKALRAENAALKDQVETMKKYISLLESKKK